MNDDLSAATHIPTLRTMVPNIKNVKLKMHSKYFAIVDPQSTDIIVNDGIQMGCCSNLLSVEKIYFLFLDEISIR